MKPIVASLLVILAFVRVAHAQEFEASTLKVSAPAPPGFRVSITVDTLRDSTLRVNNATLSECVQFAYGIASDALIVGPEWIKSRDVRFDVVGRAALQTSPETLRLMMQNLLANRLKLAVHYEKREQPFLALVIAKDGPKFSATSAPAVPLSKLAAAPDDRDALALVNGRVAHPTMPMPILATLLSRFEHQTIIDMTNLQGPFPIVLQWTPEVSNARPVDPDRPALETALQEQLGLQLEWRVGPVDALVIDYAEKVPADN